MAKNSSTKKGEGRKGKEIVDTKWTRNAKSSSRVSREVEGNGCVNAREGSPPLKVKASDIVG